jgi:HAD superfamily hydrolase (TIGR01549 family)
MIAGIIFDLDGTLGDTLPLCIKAFRQAIEPLAARTLTDEEIIATFGPSEEGTIRLLIPDHYEEALTAYLQGYTAMHDLCPTPFPGIPELLNSLRKKGVRLALVTGKGPKSTVISLERFGLNDFFTQVETGSPAGPVKAEKITTVLQAWKEIPKSQVIYVGDAPSDITASRQAGIAVVAAAWAPTAGPKRLQALHPDKLFYTVEAFRQWVEPLTPVIPPAKHSPDSPAPPARSDIPR